MNEIFRIVSLTLPLLLPGLILIFVLKRKLLNFLDYPLDFGLSLNGKRIFGNNKTFIGVVVMLIMAIIVSYFLHLGYDNGYELFISSVFSKSPFLIGAIYSISYTLGELINSFIKRQNSISAGKVTSSEYKNLQMFFDLSDGIIVAVTALIFFASVPVYQALVAGFIGIFIHYSTDLLMKRLSLK